MSEFASQRRTSLHARMTQTLNLLTAHMMQFAFVARNHPNPDMRRDAAAAHARLVDAEAAVKEADQILRGPTQG